MVSYLITDPKYYTQDLDQFEKNFTLHARAHKPDFALLRDKDNKDYKNLSKLFVFLCDSLDVKSFIHSDVDLALSLKAYGVHLPFSLISHLKKAKENNLFSIVSTHSLQEALQAQEMGANAITYSPIFDTPNKGKPVGLEKLKEIIDKIRINCFSLGGIVSPLHVKECLHVNPYGFASIRYFTRR